MREMRNEKRETGRSFGEQARNNRSRSEYRPRRPIDHHSVRTRPLAPFSASHFHLPHPHPICFHFFAPTSQLALLLAIRASTGARLRATHSSPRRLPAREKEPPRSSLATARPTQPAFYPGSALQHLLLRPTSPRPLVRSGKPTPSFPSFHPHQPPQRIARKWISNI